MPGQLQPPVLRWAVLQALASKDRMGKPMSMDLPASSFHPVNEGAAPILTGLAYTYAREMSHDAGYVPCKSVHSPKHYLAVLNLPAQAFSCRMLTESYHCQIPPC